MKKAKAPQSKSKLPPLSKSELMGVVAYLYSILDDIDSAGDVAKGDDAAYRARVERLHGKRSLVAKSLDGQSIVVNALPYWYAKDITIADSTGEGVIMGEGIECQPVAEQTECTPTPVRIYYSLRIAGLKLKKQKSVYRLKTDVLEVLKLDGHKVFDPTDVDLDWLHPQAVIDHDKNLINNSELLIVDLCHGIGAGSMMEMQYAKDMGKHVIAIVPDYDSFRQMSCWITAHVDVAVAVDCLSDLNYIVSILGDTFYK